MYICISAPIPASRRMYIYIYIQIHNNKCMCMYIYIYRILSLWYRLSFHMSILHIELCIYTCVYIYIRICRYIYIYRNISMWNQWNRSDFHMSIYYNIRIYISYTGKCLEIATSTRIAHYFWKDAFDWFFRISFRFSDLIIDGWYFHRF